MQVANNENFITALPIDLNQVESISQCRSCSGHDYSGEDVDGQSETNRSMKHYFLPLPQWRGTINQIKIFAPFDGKMASIQDDNQVVNVGKQLWLTPTSNPSWIFVYFHITPVVSEGESFKSGQIIGYANLHSYEDFDIALKRFVNADGTPRILDQMSHKFWQTLLKRA